MKVLNKMHFIEEEEEEEIRALADRNCYWLKVEPERFHLGQQPTKMTPLSGQETTRMKLRT
jgi:hypothetical protein